MKHAPAFILMLASRRETLAPSMPLWLLDFGWRRKEQNKMSAPMRGYALLSLRCDKQRMMAYDQSYGDAFGIFCGAQTKTEIFHASVRIETRNRIHDSNPT